MRPTSIGLLWLTVSTAGAAMAIQDPFQITGGYVSGMEANADGSVRGYLGIPYAAPPIGDLRWRPPRPVVGWPALYEAIAFGPACPQQPYPRGVYAGPEEEKSEDCLYLNLWTGAAAPGEKRPVMVWIHGGGLTRGSGSRPTYDGTALAEKGAVVVSVNYRLGALGYLAHPALSAESEHHASGNYGVLDQIAALRWVQSNVELFGGDPGNVTIFGESAGSWSVHALVVSPLARGLFHRAIGQSGGLFGAMPELRQDRPGRPAAEQRGAALAATLGVEGDGAAAAKALRALPADRILAASSDPGAFTTRPVVDGWVLPKSPEATFAAGEQAAVPMMLGSTADEATTLFPNVAATREALATTIEDRYGQAAPALLEAYGVGADADAARAHRELLRDEWFTCQMRAWARGMATVEAPAYLYYFTHAPARDDYPNLGAYHGAEIMYAFDNLSLVPEIEVSETDRRLAEQMSAYWIGFARSGRPHGEGLPEWPAYEQDRSYLDLGDELRLGRGLADAACEVIDPASD